MDKGQALLEAVLEKAEALVRVADQHSLASANAGSYRGDPAVVKAMQRLGNAVETVVAYRREA